MRSKTESLITNVLSLTDAVDTRVKLTNRKGDLTSGPRVPTEVLDE